MSSFFFFFFSLPFAALVTQPTLVAAATKEAVTCPKNQSCKSETEKPGYVASCFPPFRIVDSYMFLRVSPKQGLESGGQTSRSEGSLHHVLPRGFLCTYSLLLERVFPRQTCMRNSHPFCISSAESACCFSAC